MPQQPILVFMTVSTREETSKIVHSLLEEKLIAYANIVGPVDSFFWWKEKIEKANEFLVLMKSQSNLFGKISKRVKELHSYEIPELIALRMEKGLPAYLNWINEVVETGE